MDFYYIILSIVGAPFLLLTTLFIALTIQIFARKSIRDSNYPPVKGTVFGQLFYYNKLYDQQTAIARKHKTSRLLAPHHSEIYTTDPRNIEHFLKAKFGQYSKGEFNKEIWRELIGEGILMADGNEWRHQRKLASYEFSARVLRDFSCSVFRQNAAKLVGIIHQLSKHNQVFDAQEILMRYGLESIFKVGFGADLNCLDGTNEEGTKFIKALDDSNEKLSRRYVDPLWKIKRYLNIGSEKTTKKNTRFIHDFIDNVIQSKREQMEKQENYNNKEDILSRFLLESKKGSGTMTDEKLRDIILNFILAGKDTTANTLSWFIYALCKNPLIQEKIEQEIKEIINTDNKIDDFFESITDEALEKMHYLQATLTETLRLYPAVPMDGRTAEVEDILPDGFKVKKGDTVNFVAYAMGRMSYIWGEDAEEFKPERWLKDGVFQPESPFKFIAFNAGPRTCLGKDFAYRQMKIVSTALVHFFRFRLSDDTKTVTYSIMLTLHIKGGLHISALPRTQA